MQFVKRELITNSYLLTKCVT